MSTIEHIRPKRSSKIFQSIQTAFLLKDQKKSLAKEKSPAGEKLPKILSQWLQKFSTRTSWKTFMCFRYWKIFAVAIAQNFLTAIFHRRDCFKKSCYQFIPKPIMKKNDLYENILGSNDN